jgi:hypothetical protein
LREPQPSFGNVFLRLQQRSMCLMHTQLHRQMQRPRWMLGHMFCHVSNGTDLRGRHGQCVRVLRSISLHRSLRDDHRQVRALGHMRRLQLCRAGVHLGYLPVRRHGPRLRRELHCLSPRFTLQRGRRTMPVFTGINDLVWELHGLDLRFLYGCRFCGLVAHPDRVYQRV